MSLEITTKQQVVDYLINYYEALEIVPDYKKPYYAKNRLYNQIKSSPSTMIGEHYVSPQDYDNMYYIDYYWMPLLTIKEREFLKLKINGVPEKVIYRSFPFSRPTLNALYNRCIKKILDFEKNKLKNQIHEKLC